jgi:hypothetical protein
MSSSKDGGSSIAWCCWYALKATLSIRFAILHQTKKIFSLLLLTTQIFIYTIL